MTPRTISDHGISLLKKWEGSSNAAYRDSGGAWTIGVGHLIKPTEQDLIGATLTNAEVDSLLRADLAWAEKAVNDAVKVNLTQNQFDALVSFTFNVGTSAFLDSTLLKRINARAEARQVSYEFMRWTKDNGRDVPGLVNRRKKELGLYWQHLTTLVVALLIAAAVFMVATGLTLLA